MADKITTVPKSRVGAQIGRLDNEDILRLDQAIFVFLGLASSPGTRLECHAILETAQGVANVEEIAYASPRMQGIALGPADLAASRRMKTTRVGGGHPGYRVLTDSAGDERPPPPAGSVALLDRPHGRRLRGRGHPPFYGPFGDIKDVDGCEAQFRAAFLLGCVGAWSLHPARSTSPRRSSRPIPRRSPSRRRSSRRSRTAAACT